MQRGGARGQAAALYIKMWAGRRGGELAAAVEGGLLRFPSE